MLDQNDGLQQDLPIFLLDQLVDQVYQDLVLGEDAVDTLCKLCEVDEAVVDLVLDFGELIVDELLVVADAVSLDDGLASEGVGTDFFLLSRQVRREWLKGGGCGRFYLPSAAEPR